MGVGVGLRVLEQPEDVALIRRHFQILTPENCMKPQSIHPAEDRWNFEDADRFAEFARVNKLEVVGHCLVWAKDDRTDEWMKQENGEPVSRETLLRRIEAHVQAVVGRYADVATMWDVVNEAVADSGDTLLRDSVYSRATGIDFIVTAFKAARAKDPDALLIYNDYNDQMPDKRKKVVELLTKLKEKGEPGGRLRDAGPFRARRGIDPAVTGDVRRPAEAGDQGRRLRAGHRRRQAESLVGRERQISRQAIQARPVQRRPAGRDRTATGRTVRGAFPALRRVQRHHRAGLVLEPARWRELAQRVPWRRVNHPLLFDRQRRPKPAFDAVYATLRAPRSAHAPIERRDPKSRTAHQQLIAKTKQGKIDIYFEGDSITRRWGATDYPRFLARWQRQFHGWNAANFGWGGDTTHNILWRLKNGELDGVSPKIIVLQAGTNNLPSSGPADRAAVADVVSGIKAIVATFREKTPGATIVLTAIFPRPQNKALAPAIKQINEQLASLADGKTIRFININDKLTDVKGTLLPGVSHDGLHLEEKGYDAWAAALEPIFAELLGPPAQADEAPPPTGDPAPPARRPRTDDASRGRRD